MAGEKYRMFKQFMHNELGITKDDIRDWIKEAVREEAAKLIAKTYDDYDVKREIRDMLRSPYDSIRKDITNAAATEICKHVKKLFLGGATGPQIRAAVENCGGQQPEIYDCENFEDAVRQAAKAARAGDVVLMSPASAAFDQFKNFMVRGEFYKKLVREL
jgi:hypothetical protein